MAKRTIENARVVLTGASSGIGRALALELSRRGARLIINARREAPLQALAEEIRRRGAQAQLAVGDITSADTRTDALRVAQDAYGGVDMLINNAGVGAIGLFESADGDRLRKIMEVNFFAAAELIRAALPILVQGNSPMVVNISSILGRRAIPYMSEYCASKFALTGFSESLRAELKPRGVEVLVVSPGTTETEFFDSVIEEQQATPWPKQPGVPAKVVAARIVRAMEHGRAEIIPNTRGRLLLLANRVAPRIVDRMMTRYS